jgi:glycerol-3-phosphate cytidylyltransferase
MNSRQKKVITYGTYDMLHHGHINIIRRAKDYGDYLIVGVTSEEYDRSRGKLNVSQSTKERVAAVEALEYVDEVVIEYDKHQKVSDIKEYDIDTFVIGDDWKGKFDYIQEHCELIYLPRTTGISSTQLREQLTGSIRTGIIGTGRIANRFAKEAKHVNAIGLRSVFSRNINNVENFVSENSIPFGYTNLNEFLDSGLDAVYCASPHETHYSYVKQALDAGLHVLCEKPITMSSAELEELYAIAKEKKLVLLEGIKTAFFYAFNKVLIDVKEGKIGEVCDVRATFTKLVADRSLREWQAPYGGAFNELGSYPLLLACKLFGEPKNTSFNVISAGDVDSMTTIVCEHEGGKFSYSSVGIGVKSEGNAIISGTKGYIYIPAPWWLTNTYSIRGEDPTKEETRTFDKEGDGIRYELSEFASLILRDNTESELLSYQDSLNIQKIFDKWNKFKAQN